MITYDELQAKAKLYSETRTLSVGERDSLAAILRQWYEDGFMQGYSCAGGIINAKERASCTPDTAASNTLLRWTTEEENQP